MSINQTEHVLVNIVGMLGALAIAVGPILYVDFVVGVTPSVGVMIGIVSIILGSSWYVAHANIADALFKNRST